jgi:hypothetical protein
LQFSCNVQVSKFGSFCGFPQFLGNPKISQNADFSAVFRDFEGLARPKKIHGLSAMNRFQYLDFPQFPVNFRGPKKS